MSFRSDILQTKKANKKPLIITVIILIFIAVVVALLVLSGRLVWTGGGMNALSARSVCNNDIVNKYNDAMFMINRQGASTPSIDEDGVKQLETTIKDTQGYEDDATCQTLLFWIAMYHGDYELAKSAHVGVKSLHSKGVFANNNIRGNQALFSYEKLLNGISPEAKAKAGAQ